MINVLPEIITKLKNEISEATIIHDYAYLTKNKFPIITIRELSNVTDITTIDSFIFIIDMNRQISFFQHKQPYRRIVDKAKFIS